MISHKYKCIFIHQRKCAGTSICDAFDIPWSPDSHAWHFLNQGVLSPDYPRLPPNYFRFSIVRNPYDRFISGIAFSEARGFPRRPLVETLRDLPRPPTPNDDPRGDIVRNYTHITRPQHEILYRPDGSLGIGFLMRFENLQHDFNIVCDLVKKPQMKLPHVTKSEHLPYQHYFDRDPESRDLLANHFQRDLELFDYHY
jgi:hypothetical protein